jgi:hemerythrin-like metal-binding protein
MPLIEKSRLFALDYLIIDAEHIEFIEILNELDVADKADFSALFQRLYELSLQHFEQENQLMQAHAFPARSEHEDEHQRLLSEFRQFKTRIDRGLIGFGRSFVRERLPQWLELHITGMDSALVTHLKLSEDK